MKINKKYFWCFLLFYILTIKPSSAQVNDTSSKVLVLPVPTIGRSIETNWYFGGVALFTFKNVFKTNLYSTAKLEFNYTINKQSILNTNWYLYLNQNKHILIGENAWMYFPEYYFGQGNKTKESDKVFYTAQRLELNNAFLWKYTQKWYIGMATRVQGVNELSVLNNTSKYVHELTQNNAKWTFGIGPRLLLDQRTNLLNPMANDKLIDIESVQYLRTNAGLATSYFNNIKVDVRYYHKLNKFTLLAWQLFGVYGIGDAPFRLMGLLGSDSHMRGYYLGRYRDKNYTAIQSEARIKILPWLGCTIFGGVGEVWRNTNDLSLANLKHTLGLGLRFRVDKKENINLRLDYAIGKQTSGFYVAFGEAF
jgi:hypothetical protein